MIVVSFMGYAEDHAFRKEVIAKICKNVFVLLGY